MDMLLLKALQRKDPESAAHQPWPLHCAVTLAARSHQRCNIQHQQLQLFEPL
jgi:invasion protein IalB